MTKWGRSLRSDRFRSGAHMERLAFSERNSLILRKENNKVGLWPWGGKMKDLCLNYFFF